MTLRFGTDGVRGPADEFTDTVVEALGRAAGRVLGGSSFVVGRDTRISGPRIEAALVRGLALEGVATQLVGVAPTPAVAWWSQVHNVSGAVISASHNPYGDNGIKFFGPGGLKLADAVETRLEESLDEILAATECKVSGHHSESQISSVDLSGWTQHLIDSLEGRRLDGMKIVIDCANGAASNFAPDVLLGLGAVVDVLHAEPDGCNINSECGSTHPNDLINAVLGSGADMGLAFDGDADRVVGVDENGDIIDGDQIIALCAVDMRERGRLNENTVVVTVMTNLGFRLAMDELGITVVETSVGDRNVLEALEEGRFSLGGEQSGHVIFRDMATTGDGLLTGLQLADLVYRSSDPLSVLAGGVMTRLPQVLKNVAVSRKGLEVKSLLQGEIAEVEAQLGSRGRVLVRPSGTEPLVRVMVEAETSEIADAMADHLVSAVQRVDDK